MCERNYCLICRSEMPTESGMICGKCGLEPESNAVHKLQAENETLKAANSDVRRIAEERNKFEHERDEIAKRLHDKHNEYFELSFNRMVRMQELREKNNELRNALKCANISLDGYREQKKKHDEIQSKHDAAYQAHRNLLTENAALKDALHYPECWDTMTYPTFLDALKEIGCSMGEDCCHAETERKVTEGQ